MLDKLLDGRFIFNFIISFIIYAVVNGIGLFVGLLLGIDGAPAGATRIWALIWFVCVPVVLYFALGSTLKLLDSHRWNYLSVSSSFIFSIIIISNDIISYGNVIEPFDEDWGFFVNTSFGLWIVPIIDMLGRSGLYIIAIFPSAIMWLRLTAKATGFGSKVRRLLRKINTFFPDDL
ncbi:MAG: hypothetical protein FWC66_05015 [Oscillospiraceae bacterium]|nr:hypothetical protein [Oscillospiraceae bacterium]